MITTADRLALLQRTKAGQRSLLEEMYPDLDFSTVPFREYGRLFSGRKFVPGFVGGWKTYGRSNSEDPATREILPDYSGNGRDIRLYNFDFTENSGYSGGGLVSDGIDDYGQCIKGFSLPDDYTVVAIRKYPDGSNRGMLLGKINTLWTQSAFCFEHDRSQAYSFGAQTILTGVEPSLFSYQTKDSYNGTAINFGNALDTDSNGLWLFHSKMNSYYKGCVLYDLRIYDHTLTAEELEAVKDEMMSDYEKATGGGIADIHYVADWDGKGRSNAEEEPMRSTWTDRATGKVIDLHNYAFAGMSGWGGYRQNFSAWVIINSTPYQGDLITVNANTIHIKGTFSEGYNRSGMRLDYAPLNTEEKFFLKVLGLKDGQQLYIIDETPDVGKSYIIDSDGIADIVFTTASTTSKPNPKLYIYVQITTGAETVDVTIEQQPIYPGALVSDGVDDYGETQEVINEEVGTMLVFADEELTVGTYIMRSINATPDAAGGIVCRYYNNYIYMGRPDTNVDTLAPLFVLTRTPDSPNYIMVVGAGGYSYGFGKSALYRLILIREQLDGAQVEFLRWKVEKEYRDWCRDNGYDYAINQLTE